MTIPTRYKLIGNVPPLFYMGSLFAYLDRPYYASLLTAARLHGASHHLSQTDYVMTVLPKSSVSERRNASLKWVYRKTIPSAFVLEKNGEGGVVRYSSAEMTALDVVQYSRHIGGLGDVATVLAELSEAMDASRLSRELVMCFKSSTVQRLGYLLDSVLGEDDLSAALYDAYRDVAGRANPVWLDVNAPRKFATRDRRWNVLVNAEVEADIV